MEPLILNGKKAKERCYQLRVLIACDLKRMTCGEFINKWNSHSETLCESNIFLDDSFKLLTNTIVVGEDVCKKYCEMEIERIREESDRLKQNTNEDKKKQLKIRGLYDIYIPAL